MSRPHASRCVRVSVPSPVPRERHRNRLRPCQSYVGKEKRGRHPERRRRCDQCPEHGTGRGEFLRHGGQRGAESSRRCSMCRAAPLPESVRRVRPWFVATCVDGGAARTRVAQNLHHRVPDDRLLFAFEPFEEDFGRLLYDSTFLEPDHRLVLLKKVRRWRRRFDRSQIAPSTCAHARSARKSRGQSVGRYGRGAVPPAAVTWRG